MRELYILTDGVDNKPPKWECSSRMHCTAVLIQTLGIIGVVRKADEMIRTRCLYFATKVMVGEALTMAIGLTTVRISVEERTQAMIFSNRLGMESAMTLGKSVFLLYLSTPL